MDFWQDTNWFAVQTKPYQENLAATRLAQLDLGVFLPQVRKHAMVCGATRWVIRPLFASYLFARFCPLLSYEAVRYAPGVLRVVGNRQAPIPLAPELIASVQESVQTDGFIRLEPPPLRPGTRVRIERGPFAGWMAEVEREWDEGRRVAILLRALQQARMVIDKRWLQPVETD